MSKRDRRKRYVLYGGKKENAIKEMQEVVEEIKDELHVDQEDNESQEIKISNIVEKIKQEAEKLKSIVEDLSESATELEEINQELRSRSRHSRSRIEGGRRRRRQCGGNSSLRQEQEQEQEQENDDSLYEERAEKKEEVEELEGEVMESSKYINQLIVLIPRTKTNDVHEEQIRDQMNHLYTELCTNLEFRYETAIENAKSLLEEAKKNMDIEYDYLQFSLNHLISNEGKTAKLHQRQTAIVNRLHILQEHIHKLMTFLSNPDLILQKNYSIEFLLKEVAALYVVILVLQKQLRTFNTTLRIIYNIASYSLIALKWIKPALYSAIIAGIFVAVMPYLLPTVSSSLGVTQFLTNHHLYFATISKAINVTAEYTKTPSIQRLISTVSLAANAASLYRFVRDATAPKAPVAAAAAAAAAPNENERT